jgi:hypothetical protein
LVDQARSRAGNLFSCVRHGVVWACGDGMSARRAAQASSFEMSVSATMRRIRQPLASSHRAGPGDAAACQSSAMESELAGSGVSLVDDVSRFADHHRAIVEYLGQQGEMAAVVDAGETLASSSGSSLSRS